MRDVSERLPSSLVAYRLVTGAAAPLAPILLAHRLRRGKELQSRIAERRAEASAARPPGPLIWVHGASVGEILSAMTLIERLHARGFGILVTSGTVTSAELAVQRLPSNTIHQFIPLDAPQYVARFLNHWHPDLALFMESDLWPNLILETAGRKVPMILVNGRLSEQSFRRWSRVRRTIGALLKRFQLCLAQSQEDGRRYADIGATVNITGNLKIDVAAPPADAVALGRLRKAIGDRTIVAAASTHPGEETAMIEAHRQLRHQHPDLLTLIAPRHPERGPDVVAAAEAAGLRPCLRSLGNDPNADDDIYILDTVGELGVLYRLAPIVFMGGSLISHGGQNPIEAAKLGAAILHGPHVWNFAEIYAALDSAQGAMLVTDSASLAIRIKTWFDQPNTRDSVALAGRKTVDALGGALERTLVALEPYLKPLQAGRKAGNA